MRRARGAVAREVLAVVAGGLAGLALLVRCTVGDRWVVLAPFDYACPLVLVAAGWLVAAVLWSWNGRRRVAFAALSAGLACGGAWIAQTYHGHPCEEGTLRVFLWNTARAPHGGAVVAEYVDRSGADVVGLVEAANAVEELRELAGWEAWFGEHELAVLARGRIVAAEDHEIEHVGRWAIVQLELRGGPLRVVLVDFLSHRFGNRDRLVATALQAAGRAPAVPVIVLGDFNTPIDSVWLQPLRREMTHAFEAAGHGMHVTWPDPLPVLAIDHVWLGAGLRPTCAWTEATGLSDHRAILVELDREPSAGSGRRTIAE